MGEQQGIPLPEVRRVAVGTLIGVQPALDPAWPEAQRLGWHAAVVALDTGLPIRVWSHAVDDDPGSYGISTGSSTSAALDYWDAWTFLNGVSSGARATRGDADEDLALFKARFEAAVAEGKPPMVLSSVPTLAEFVLTWHPITGGDPPVEVPLYDFITGMEDELGEFQLHTREATAEGVTTRPVLRRIDCGNGCPVTWAEVPNDVPGGCPWCASTFSREQHAGCDHKGHGRWRTWRITHRLASKAYALGLIASSGTQYGGGCPGCLVGVGWRGKRVYALGWPTSSWRCLLKFRHWPGDDTGMWGFCTKCLPCSTCGSKRAAHEPGCADDAWAGRSREDTESVQPRVELLNQAATAAETGDMTESWVRPSREDTAPGAPSQGGGAG